MTPTQSKTIERIKAAGYEVKRVESLNSCVWFVAEKPGVNIFLDRQLMGTIGERGKLNVEFQLFNYRQQITEDYMLECRLAETR